MSIAGEVQVEEISQNLPCHACGYNLRGLRGAYVHCPECGTQVDVAEMLARRWEGPWYEAPWLTQVEKPAYIAGLTLFVAGFALTAEPRAGLIVVGIGAAVWAYFMSQVGQPLLTWRGRGACAMAHSVVVGFIIGLAALLVGLGWGLKSIAEGEYKRGVWLLAAGVIGLLAMLAARWGQRRLAKICIGLYLDRLPD